MKKLMNLIIIITIIFSLNTSLCVAQTENLQSLPELKQGDYFLMGKYNDEPILWRYVNNDNNKIFSNDAIYDETNNIIIKKSDYNDKYEIGKFDNGKFYFDEINYNIDMESKVLLYSDKILCFKEFDTVEDLHNKETNFWKESSIRKWLNSTDLNIVEYNKESGFISRTNFTNSQRSIMINSNIQTYWPIERVSKDIIKYPFGLFKNMYGETNAHGDNYYTIPRVGYMITGKGGVKNITQDKIFLLEEEQIYNIFKSFDSAVSQLSEGLKFEYEKANYNYAYWIRSPYNANEAEAGINGCIISGEVLEDTQNMHHLPYSNIDFKVGDKYTKSSVTEKKGIRPAFYLNTESAIILSGTGTKEDPYVLDGKPVISVNLNNTELDFYDQPVIKDGIIMLPMDEIYKYLGAKTIDWNNEYKSIAMEYNGNYIYMMLDNKGIIVNGKSYDMGYPMTMIDDVAYVPLTAIEKSITPNVTWNGEQYRIDIN